MTPGPPRCPQCDAYVGRRGHTCRARPDVSHLQLLATLPNPPARPEPITEPDEVRRRIEECRAALASTAPPPARPAGRVDLFRERPLA